MKKAFLILTVLIFSSTMAQKFNYDKEWKEIEKREKKGEYKSLLPQIDKIYNQASKDENYPHIIKSLLYKSSILNITSDDDDYENEVIKNFRDEINRASGPGKAVLQSYLADLYNLYYSSNRYKIWNRTNVDGSQSDDFRFWTESGFHDNIVNLYLESVKNPSELQSQSIKDWEYLLNGVGNKEFSMVRPTLYDLLAHRAIDFFKRKNDIFWNMSFDEEENRENGKNTDLLYTGLISFHKQKGNSEALAYNELECLKYRKDKLSNEEYETELLDLNQRNPNNGFSPVLLWELSLYYKGLIGSTDADDFAGKKRLTEKSVFYLDEILTKFPSSDYSEEASKAKKNFLLSDFKIEIQDYISSDQINPIRVEHKNTDKLYFKIYDLNSPNDRDIFNYMRRNNNNEIQKTIKKIGNTLTLIDQFTVDLKVFDDYQYHSTLVKFNPLKPGLYFVMVSANPNFKVEDMAGVEYRVVNVTDYSLVFRDDEVLLTDRETGAPLPGKEIHITNNRSGKDRVDTKRITDEFGKISLKGINDLRYFDGRFNIENQDIYFDHYFYFNRETKSKKTETYVKYFTDRKIYRPGQTVYFKAILYEEDEDGNRKVVPNETVDIDLINPNDDEVSTLTLKSNEYGSVFGEFVLPSGGLTGEYYLEDDFSNSDYEFSVEEYKRPKFEVGFDDIEDIFRLDEEITVKGKATAYSGANIDNAKVTYRVYRTAIYPYRPWWGGKAYNNEPSEEIIHGETLTDSDGKFEVKFNAKPAKEKKEGSPRTYTYRVVADVTDINGETHSSERSVTVGDLRYRLDFTVTQKIEISKFDSLNINTRNLNGKFYPAKGRVSLTKINPSDRVLRNTLFTGTDYQLYGKEEFMGYFPNEPYGNEKDKQNWQKGKTVLDTDFDTDKSKSVKVKASKWEEGYYILSGYIKDGNDSIKSERLVYLYRNEKQKPVDNELFSIHVLQPEYEPGEIAKIQLSSATKNSEVLVELEVKGKIVKSEWIELNNDVKYFSFPVEENHRGNVFVHYYFGRFNNGESGKVIVNVPYPDKSLKITASTLRDKLQPGQEEIWELTVSGEDKDKFLAEMLAGMYDASLDEFRANSLSFPMIVGNNYSAYSNWILYRSFKKSGFSYLKLPNQLNYGWYGNKLYFDDFSYFGFTWEKIRYNKMATGAPWPEYQKETMGAEIEVAEVGFFNELQGNAPGVVVSGSSGSLGSAKIDVLIRGKGSFDSGAEPLIVIDGVVVSLDSINLDDYDDITILRDAEATAIYGNRGANGVILITTSKSKEQLAEVQARRNLQETAFFYPDLRTDKDGNIKIRFTVPESLTQWKFMAMAHTPDLKTGYYETTVRTQKELMVVPNPPRFLREGDQITFSSKVINLSDELLNGKAQLMLFDAFTMQPVDEEFGNLSPIRDINIAKGNSDNVSWTLTVPKTSQAVVYRVVATVGNFSDGEESALPILTNRMMVTETLPIHIREGQNKTFTLDKLQNNTSTTLDNFKLTFEMTANPIWYAIFSLPYLREYPYECSEQVFARLYGNLISEHIINSNPKIKAVFDDWNSKGELKSKLEQNEELKSILLEETPWVRQAEREEDQMKKIAILFDLNQMRNEQTHTFDKLKTKQSPSGGFPWFEGGNDNIYITTHIVSSFGQLKAMNIEYQNRFGGDLEKMLKNAVSFIDRKMEEEYDRYLKDKDKKPSIYNGIHYLYARSMFQEEYPLSNKGNQIKNYYLKEFEKDMYDYSLQTKAMVALIFNRYGKEKQALSLLNSIKERAVDSDEMGMYWKSNTAGWFWYQAPIETQAMIIIAFDEITDDIESVESMKVWLLKNRQTNDWRSTKATTEAVFALMNTGKYWTNSEEGLTIRIGDKPLNIEELEKSPQSGTGYIKTSWNGEEIKPEMGKVEVDKTSPGVAWGALYWQYFEDLDKITSAETGIKFKKELFLKKNSDKGPVLTRITEDTPIKVGDLVSVRLEIQTDRAMEFVHIKDMRASGFEPVNVFSRYKWQDGIGYYESTRDAATNFFVDRMPKGTYVFEYEVRANNAGNFSNGITSMQNMYAPELSAHSEGIRVEIK